MRPARLRARLKRAALRRWAMVCAAAQEGAGRMRWAGAAGLVGFWSYGYLWTVVWPQSYDNWGLRMLAACASAGLLFNGGGKRALRGWEVWYWLATMLYTLPFFFSFLWAQSGGTGVRSLSFAVAAIAPLMMLDRVSALVVSLVGSAAGLALSVLVNGGHVPFFLSGEWAAVLVFVIGAGVLLNTSQERARGRQLHAAAAVAAKVAHEMRTQLQQMGFGVSAMRALVQQQGAASGLPERCPCAEIGELVSASVERAAALIGMLEASAGVGGNGGGQARSSVCDALKSALDGYPWPGGEERERVRVVVHGGRDLVVPLAKPALEMVLMQLIDNAMHALRESDQANGYVKVITRRDAEGAVIEVVDNGCGIPFGEHASIFEPFYSLREGRTGLGLHYCRQRITAAGGTIHAETRGSDTALVVRFPGEWEDGGCVDPSVQFAARGAAR